MKTMITSLILASLLWSGCTEVNPTYTPPVPEEPVTESTGFALGADISWTTQLESEGEVFYNADGQNMECTVLMKDLGMNAIRLRVWVDPEGNWCSKSDVVAKALRAQKLGMRIMIDFHYSDTWADPGKQVIPAAWLEYADDTERLAEAVAEHTREVLTLLKDNGIDVEWVQVGNETTNGMMYDSSLDENGEAVRLENGGGYVRENPENYAAYTKAGCEAVKAVYPEGLSQETITDAIAEFEKSLVTPDSAFDLYLKGDENAMTAEQIEGYDLFKEYSCATCHAGVNMGGLTYELMGQRDNYFEDRDLTLKSGLTDGDNGRWAQTGVERDRYRFKTPGLRNVALTWPYYHDGSVATLDEAVRKMARFQVGKKISDKDADLCRGFVHLQNCGFTKKAKEWSALRYAGYDPTGIEQKDYSIFCLWKEWAFLDYPVRSKNN